MTPWLGLASDSRAADRAPAALDAATDGVVVIGAGGHAKVVISTLTACGTPVAAVVDDDDSKWGTDAQGTRVGRIERARGGRGIVGIGDNAQRREMVRALGLEWQIAVHPAAYVHPSA